MDRVEQAVRVLLEQIGARIAALDLEVRERIQAIDQLRDVEATLQSLPLWGDAQELAIRASLVVRDDEFDHLTMADAAAEVLRRAGKPMHAQDIWFAVMKGGYPHHSPSSFQALVTCMNRLKSRFKRVRPNVFTLLNAAERGEVASAAATGNQDGCKERTIHP